MMGGLYFPFIIFQMKLSIFDRYPAKDCAIIYTIWRAKFSGTKFTICLYSSVRFN